jgi:glycosyltransferase involved in cell wall biosynthesis
MDPGGGQVNPMALAQRAQRGMMEPSPSNRGLIIVGNMLGATTGIRPVGEDLGAGLRKRGWRVYLTASCQSQILRLLRMVWDILRRVGQYDIALIDVFSGRAFIWAEVVSAVVKILGKPLVLTLHGGGLPEFSRAFPLRVARVMNRADVVTAPSRFLSEALGSLRRDIQVIPNPVDVSSYAWKLRRTADPRLVWVRAFHEIYDPELAPNVIALLCQEFPGIRLSMIGRDKGDGSRQKTEEIARKVGVFDRIEFVGGVEKHEVPLWLDRADIFINTTRFDNVPVSVVEAMAAGLCVVSTNAGGIPYLIDNETDGLLVPVGDARAMAAAVTGVLRNPDLAERLSANAKAKASRFESNAVFDTWNRLLRDIVRQKEERI